MARAFVSAGSNIDPETNVKEAIRRLSRLVMVKAVSTVYRTAPIGTSGQPHYFNCVIEIDTDLPPLILKTDVLRPLEAKGGRLRTGDKYATRPIDLDLILYDDVIMKSEELVLPDPDILSRPFLAIALRELAPGLVVPGSGVRIEDLAEAVSRDAMEPLQLYTELIRKDILHERTE